MIINDLPENQRWIKKKNLKPLFDLVETVSEIGLRKSAKFENKHKSKTRSVKAM